MAMYMQVQAGNKIETINSTATVAAWQVAKARVTRNHLATQG